MPARRSNSLGDWFRSSERDVRDQLASKSVRRASQKYMGVAIHPAPDGWYVGRDKDDIFDTLTDAKSFIKAGSKRGMRFNKGTEVTDRAHRYRAQQNVPSGPKKCVKCNSTRFVCVDHKDGNESNDRPSNLQWMCKSCNTKKGVSQSRKGVGRRTKQFNPGADNLAQYTLAVSEHRRGAHDAAGKIIHETPKSKRREFAKEIWDRRRARGTDSSMPDWARSNPGLIEEFIAQDILTKVSKGNSKKRNPRKANSPEASAACYENFHGEPSKEIIDIKTPIHYHKNLWSLGRLIEMVIRYEDGDREYDVIVRGFKGAYLAANEKRNQLYIEGGDQSIDLSEFGIEKPYHEHEVLGRMVMVAYHTNKTHLGKDGGKADYVHCIERCKRYTDLGLKQISASAEGEGPTVTYDVKNRLLSLAGGSYTIPDEGIEY